MNKPTVRNYLIFLAKYIINFESYILEKERMYEDVRSIIDEIKYKKIEYNILLRFTDLQVVHYYHAENEREVIYTNTIKKMTHCIRTSEGTLIKRMKSGELINGYLVKKVIIDYSVGKPFMPPDYLLKLIA